MNGGDEGLEEGETHPLMGLFELLELVQRRIHIDAAGHDALALLVDVRGADIVSDGRLFCYLPRDRSFPQTEDHD
jgi:hypothetical protein